VKGKGIEIEVLLSEAEIAEGFLEALARRFLPERYFYWFPVSVRAWLQLCQDGPYRNFIRSDRLVRAGAEAIIGSLPPGPIEVMSLGSGQGTKDLHLLDALAAARRAAAYRPVDAGQMLLEMACADAERHGIAATGVKADLTKRAHLDALRPDAGSPSRLVLLLGNTLGGFDPPAMLHALRSVLRETDLLLVDGELHNDQDTRAGYDNLLNRNFVLAPLQSIGIRETDGELVFEPLADLSPGIHRLGKYFRTRVDLALRIAGETFSLKAGERIRMNHSGKYERKAFLSLLADAGFKPVKDWTSDDDRFVMVLARPSAG
jgi:L-histidine N-alpha-methyltransferase